MGSYTLVVFIHIAAAVLLLATSILGEPAVRAAARRTTSPQELRAFLEVGRPMSVLSPVAAVVLLASGIYLATVGRFWTLGWVQVATAFWVVNSALAGLVVRPAIDRVAAAASDATDRSIGERLDAARWSSGWSLGVDAMAANDAAILYLMTMKPGFAGSLAVVLVANLAVAGVRFMFSAPRPAVPEVAVRPPT